MYKIRVEANFSAAHFLSQYQGKCENLHGHNYRVRVFARGSELDQSGMLLDFGVLKKTLNEVVDGLDHRLLNEVPEFQNSPSAERIAAFIYQGIKIALPGVSLEAVEVFESDKSMARYEE